MEKMEFDPMLGANKPKKELEKKQQVVENTKLMPENIVYNPKTGKSDFAENLPFAEDGGHIILEKGDEKIAKTQTLPLANMLEAGKKIIKEAEEFPEDIEE